MVSALPRSPSTEREAEEAERFLAALDHPLRAEILALDRAVRAVDRRIRPGVKWNSLSWATSDYFGTVFLRSTEEVQVVLHCGVKGKRSARPSIADPAGLLDWKAHERAVARLGQGEEFRRALPAFCAVVRQWIAQI